MPPVIEQTLEITVTGQPGAYRVEARTDGNPTSPAPLPWPPPDADPETIRFRVSEGFELSDELLRDFGHALYDVLLQDEAQRRLDQLTGRGEPFRIRLIVHPAELTLMPWELLHDGGGDATGYLALRADFPLVRGTPTRGLVTQGFVEDRIRVLFLGASPPDRPPLEVEAEENNLREALKELEDAGRVELIVYQDATLDDLRRGLDRRPHVIHFAGHGMFDPAADSGGLVLVGADGKGHLLTGEGLAMLLQGAGARLALLAACRTAESDVDRPYAGVAQRVMQACSLPAMIAMQFPIGDASAVAFNKELYESLAAESPVDVAATRARQVVWLARRPNTLADWATPVLYMLGDQGHLWEGTMTDEEKREKDEAQTNDESRFRISVGGDVKGDMKIAGRDIVEGDQVAGDKITVGDISGSTGVAIGPGASASVTTVTQEGLTFEDFQDVYEWLKSLDLPADDKKEVEYAVKQIEKQATAEEPDEDKLDKWLEFLERTAPDVIEVLFNLATNPGAAVGAGVRAAIKAARMALRKD